MVDFNPFIHFNEIFISGFSHIQYKIDLLTQATQNVNSQFRKAVSGVQDASAAGKKKADRVVQETTTLLTQTEAEQKGYTTNMGNLLEQIRGINSNIDNSVLDISTDCLDKCKTGIIALCYHKYTLNLRYMDEARIFRIGAKACTSKG